MKIVLYQNDWKPIIIIEANGVNGEIKSARKHRMSASRFEQQYCSTNGVLVALKRVAGSNATSRARRPSRIALANVVTSHQARQLVSPGSCIVSRLVIISNHGDNRQHRRFFGSELSARHLPALVDGSATPREAAVDKMRLAEAGPW